MGPGVSGFPSNPEHSQTCHPWHSPSECSGGRNWAVFTSKLPEPRASLPKVSCACASSFLLERRNRRGLCLHGRDAFQLSTKGRHFCPHV